MFNVNNRNNQFLYDSRIIDSSSAISSSRCSIGISVSSSSNANSNITSIPNYNNDTPKFYPSITPGARVIWNIRINKKETDDNVKIEPDRNTMKCAIKTKEGAFSFDIDNSLASLLGFTKILFNAGKPTTQKPADIMGFNPNNIHCNVISGVKNKGNITDILYAFNIMKPPGYMMNIIPNNILHPNIIKERIEYI